jgi:hypothetical protein
LAAAHISGKIADHDEMMATLGEFVARGLRDAGFHPQVAPTQLVLVETRGFESCLDVHFVIRDVGD